MEQKKCAKCDAEKPITEFYRELKRNGIAGEWRASKCKSCKNAEVYASRDKSREKYNTYARERRRDPEINARQRELERARYHDPDGKRKAQCEASRKKQRELGRHLEYDYGITLQQRQEMFEKQNGCCKLCGSEESILKKKLCVDHCHASGKVRGLLCDDCNRMLGLARDREDTLANALAYLKKDAESL